VYRYVIKRILLLIPVLLGISFVVFALMDMAPGDPARMILGEAASMSDVEALREGMGLNDNFFVRYLRQVWNMVRGNFGMSYSFKTPVFDLIMPAIPVTIKLALGSMVIMVLLGIPIGVISAVKKYTWIDTMSLTGSLLITSMPAFWMGLMMILLFALHLRLLPATGDDVFRNYILPCFTLGAGMMADLVRMTRSSMLEVVKQDYVRTARAKGAKERTVVYKHALRNALMPVVTIVGLNFSALLGGSMVIENVFAMSGIGSLIIRSVNQRDTPLVLTAVMLVALMTGIVNLIVDIFYAYIDPRIKSQYVRAKRVKAVLAVLRRAA
jgi:peptide/nickel transport system permease protein